MRQIGTVPTREEAQRLTAFLLVRGIRGQIEAEGDRWGVWVYEEDQLEGARSDFARFVENPQAPEFLEAEAAAQQFLDQQLEHRRHKAQVVNLRERWQPPVATRQFLTLLLIGISILIAIQTNFCEDLQSPLVQKMLIASFQQDGQFLRWRGLKEIQEGEVWRAVTPIFLHFNWMHLLFNMMWMANLGMLIEDRRGRWRLLALVLIIAVISNLSQYWWQYWRMHDEPSAPMTFGGMSGVVYGLLGYTWMKSRYSPASGLYLTQNTLMYSIIWLVVCMLGMVGHVANAAHLVGFAVGIALGLIPFL